MLVKVNIQNKNNQKYKLLSTIEVQAWLSHICTHCCLPNMKSLFSVSQTNTTMSAFIMKSINLCNRVCLLVPATLYQKVDNCTVCQ